MDISSMLAAGSSGRITGMATGLDTDQMVKDMLKGEILKVDKVYQDKSYLELKQQAYRDIIKGVKEFQKYFDTTSDKYISLNDFNTSKVTLSDEKYFSATASTSAANGIYKVKVNQLAEAAKLEGSSIGGVYTLDDTTKNKEFDVVDTNGVSIGKVKMDGSNNITLDASLNDKINIKTYEKDGKTYVKVENIGGDTLKIDYDGMGVGSDPKELVNLSDDTKLTQLGITEGTHTLKFNGCANVDLVVDAETNISDLKNKISEASGGKVTIEIDSNLNRVNFVSTNTGKEAEINIELMDQNIKDSLGVTIPAEIPTGQDAEVEITMPDSLKTTVTSSSNQVSELGLDINLKLADNTKEIEVTVDKQGSVDKTLDKIKSFIKDYNAIVSSIHDKLSEKKNYSYKPLTEEQKKTMKEDEISTWNNKVKTGILSGDHLLEKILTDLRGCFNTQIIGAEGRFGKYGENTIGLDSFSNFKKSGQIDLDETELKEVLNQSPELIEEFFTKISDKALDPDKVYMNSDKFNEEGILTRINAVLRDYVGLPGIGEDGKSTLKGSMNIMINKQYDYSISGYTSKNTIPDQMYKKQLSLEKLQRKIFAKQEKLYSQFSKLETAMNQLNSQSNYMMSQLG